MSRIGIFDSGVGGLTVVRAVRKALPSEEIVYLGDTARVPYGAKSPDTIIRYSLACARFLLARDVQLLLVACNTASAHAIQALQELPIPVIGAVGPGAQTAANASKSGHIGVIGTLGTIRSQAYVSALAVLAPHAMVSGQACPLFVPLAEEGWTSGEIAAAICERYLAELAEKDPLIDTLVLGCTHYPLLAEVIGMAAARVFHRPVQLVDSATAMASAAVALGAPGLGPRTSGRLSICVTDDSRLEELAPRFLGEPLDSFERVDL
jgi:glutamate racemase